MLLLIISERDATYPLNTCTNENGNDIDVTHCARGPLHIRRAALLSFWKLIVSVLVDGFAGMPTRSSPPIFPLLCSGPPALRAKNNTCLRYRQPKQSVRLTFNSDGRQAGPRQRNRTTEFVTDLRVEFAARVAGGYQSSPPLFDNRLRLFGYRY